MKVESCPKVGPKICLRPKMSAEKELRGENGAFDSETARFGGDVRLRSAPKRPKSGQAHAWWRHATLLGQVVPQRLKNISFGYAIAQTFPTAVAPPGAVMWGDAATVLVSTGRFLAQSKAACLAGTFFERCFHPHLDFDRPTGRTAATS